MKTYNCLQTNGNYHIEIVTWSHKIVYKIFVFNMNTWNHKIV